MALRGATFGCTHIAKKKYSSIVVPSNFGFGNSGFRPSPYCRPGLLYPIRAINQEVVANPMTSKKENVEQSPDNWKIKMLYDGDCPLCMREVNMLRERNIRYETIKFVDISSDDYSPEENQGLDYKTVMGRIHAILSDGTVVTDVEAFRRLYEEVGLGWVYAITTYEPIATIADAVYGVWAKYRLQITGRPGLEEILEARRKSKVGKGIKHAMIAIPVRGDLVMKLPTIVGARSVFRCPC